MHCDIVVKLDRQAGFVGLIGGNVSQSVNLTMINIVPAAKGRPARVQTSADISGARPYFAILELTTGRRGLARPHAGDRADHRSLSGLADLRSGSA